MSPAQAHIFQGVSSPVALRQNLVGEKKFPGEAEPHLSRETNETWVIERKSTQPVRARLKHGLCKGRLELRTKGMEIGIQEATFWTKVSACDNYWREIYHAKNSVKWKRLFKRLQHPEE